jgi:di- and tripeptidase
MEQEGMNQARESTHRISTNKSVQAVVVDQDVVFAGLQGGIIAAYSLETYELLANVYAHEESVLGLALSEGKELLFSTGADSVVKVWSTDTLECLYSLYSTHEIGDVFCISHSARRATLFYGAQNGSISWFRLKSDDLTSPRVAFSPGSHKHRFFDSRGPGGTLTSLQLRDADVQSLHQAGERLTLRSDQYQSYAHTSYVYSSVLAKGLFRHDAEEEVLITGGGGGSIRLWKIDDLNEAGVVPVLRFKNKGFSVLDMAYSFPFLYVGLSEGHVNVYNLSSNQLIQRLNAGTADITQVTFNQGIICCGTSDGLIKVCFPGYDDDGLTMI